MEVLSTDGYRAAKSKHQFPAGEACINSNSVDMNLADLSGNRDSLANSTNSSQNLEIHGGNGKHRKTPKFMDHLDDGSAAAFLDLGHSNASSEHREGWFCSKRSLAERWWAKIVYQLSEGSCKVMSITTISFVPSEAWNFLDGIVWLHVFQDYQTRHQFVLSVQQAEQERD